MYLWNELCPKTWFTVNGCHWHVTDKNIFKSQSLKSLSLNYGDKKFLEFLKTYFQNVKYIFCLFMLSLRDIFLSLTLRKKLRVYNMVGWNTIFHIFFFSNWNVSPVAILYFLVSIFICYFYCQNTFEWKKFFWRKKSHENTWSMFCAGKCILLQEN